MPLRLKVREIMVPAGEFPALHEDADVASAFKLFREYFRCKDGTWMGFQSALVYNSRGRAVGILTLRGLLRALQLQALLDDLLKGDPVGLFFLPPRWSEQFITVKEVMRPVETAFINEDAALWEAALLMLNKKVNSVPVMAGDNLCGVVRTIDLFWLIGEILEDMA
ncbi:CBS domain-containing protein [Desulfofundulus thermosubterraneus]|uniref:CBS domain-containing protein n=1 Tax=Desulfofundulus thermosubterraneus DSM 16057 TaxID=1121432 RepID=A0A1M6ANQ6_9FIRM|nr:CBS domain-containing protein [Desulfofundulus thermosubterraneus]SHI38095.1 CBS domain-containing protein [Desulfofundulus thermosubterraneus DSM 16057]